MSDRSNTVLAVAESPMNEIDFSVAEFLNEPVFISELPFKGYLNLRGSTGNNAFLSATEQVLGTALPLEHNTFVDHQGLLVFWLGPDEWLIVCAEGEQTRLRDDLRTALEECFCAITDVTGGNTMLAISGTSADELIRKGCTIDVHASVFGPGQCAQTMMAKTAVLLFEQDDKAASDAVANFRDFRIIVRRSFADYLGVWLQDAAREFAPD